MLAVPARHDVLSRCLACPAHLQGPCRGAGPEALAALARGSQTCHFERGATIVYQGEEDAQVGIVVSGVVKQTNIAADGRKTVVALLERGGIVGSITGANPRFAFEAASPVTLCSMSQRLFWRVLHDHPEVACQTLERSMKQSEEVQEWLTLFNCRTTLQRLAGYLHALTLAHAADKAAGEAVRLEIPIGRKDLAAYLGTTPETLSRNFHRLKAQAILSIIDGSHVVVIDAAKLGRVAGKSSEELHSLSRAADAPDARDDGLAATRTNIRRLAAATV